MERALDSSIASGHPGRRFPQSSGRVFFVKDGELRCSSFAIDALSVGRGSLGASIQQGAQRCLDSWMMALQWNA